MEAGGTQDDAPNSMQERLDALIADWGKADSIYDFDGDGTVGIRDFLTLLGRMGGQEPQNSPPPQGAQRVPPGIIQQFRAAYNRVVAATVARSLLPQLDSMDPGELRQKLEENLPPGSDAPFSSSSRPCTRKATT